MLLRSWRFEEMVQNNVHEEGGVLFFASVQYSTRQQKRRIADSFPDVLSRTICFSSSQEKPSCIKRITILKIHGQSGEKELFDAL